MQEESVVNEEEQEGQEEGCQCLRDNPFVLNVQFFQHTTNRVFNVQFVPISLITWKCI